MRNEISVAKLREFARKYVNEEPERSGKSRLVANAAADGGA